MPSFKFFSLWSCFHGCQDNARGVSRLSTRVWNLTDRPIELQIRVGSILKKGHTLKPNSSKRLKCKSIYKAYMPNGRSEGMKNWLYYYDETCQPYVWIHDCVGDSSSSSSRMVKQQFISLDDLRDFSEIRVFRDHQRGCISIRKKPRPDFC